MRIGSLLGVYVIAATAWSGYIPSVLAQTPYYQGKTIKLIQGRSPGGSGDIRSRVVVPYLRKYIPGNPNIVVEFMPGAGGRKAVNHIYNVARPDGLTIGHVSSGIVTSAVLGETGVQYDIEKITWLGATESAFHYAFFTRKELGLNTPEKLAAYPGLRIGATETGHTTYTYGRTFAWLLNLKDPRFVLGYSSIEVDVAMARGELDARSNNTLEIIRRNPDALKKDMFDFAAVLKIPAEESDAHFDHLTPLDKFVKAERERRFLTLTRATRSIGTPYLAPPNMPKELVQILRDAMKKTFQDPEFRKEFAKMSGEESSPILPEVQEKIIRTVPRDPETVELFKWINGNKPLPPR